MSRKGQIYCLNQKAGLQKATSFRTRKALCSVALVFLCFDPYFIALSLWP